MPALVKSTPSLPSVSDASSGYITALEEASAGMPVIPVGRCINRLGRVTVEEDDVAGGSSDDMELGFASSSDGDVESNGDPWLGSGEETATAGAVSVNDGSGECWVSGTGGEGPPRRRIK